MNHCLVVAWHNPVVRDAFCKAWRITGDEPWVVLQQDPGWKSCARTKNAGIEEAMRRGAEIITILDDDCLPYGATATIESFMADHEQALEPQPVELFQTITTPRSRGTPHLPENRTLTMPVAASMSFWRHVPDFDAPSQLAHGATHAMHYNRGTIHGRYFAMSGMALSFRASWWPICQFIDIARYDDIAQGLIWQKIAFAKGYCFSVGLAQDIWHSRQSNVWSNLRDEVKHMEQFETLWRDIHAYPSNDYEALRGLLPVPNGKDHA